VSCNLDNIDDTLFRAYDIRGIVGESLTEAVAYHLGRAFAAQARAQAIRNTVVGADGRLSSPALKKQLIQGLLDGGLDVTDIGYIATPVLYFAAHHTDTKTGIMITGSHNPKAYNGFKMMMAGNTLAEQDIQALKYRMLDKNYDSDTSKRLGSLHSHDFRAQYRKRILDDISLARPLKVVIDCGNGILGETAPYLLEQLGCEVIPLYCDVDGNFPNHHPDPSKADNLAECITAVKTQQADVGLAFDGDGDRVGVITADGNIIDADRLTMLFAEDVLTRNPGAKILFDVKCSRQLAHVITQAGGVPTMWKTGHSMLKRKMKATGALLAGEMSGHIFFKERWFGFDDGLYAAARLLEILASQPEPLASLFARYPQDISTPELSVEVSEASKFAIIKELQQRAFPEGSKTLIDGLRVDYADGWGLCRASNTTPTLVLRFEADNETALTRIKNQFQIQLHAIDSTINIPCA